MAGTPRASSRQVPGRWNSSPRAMQNVQCRLCRARGAQTVFRILSWHTFRGHTELRQLLKELNGSELDGRQVHAPRP